MEEIDLIYDLHMPWQYTAHQRHCPPFQSFGQNSMIGVRTRLHGYVPCGIPGQTFDVDKDPHQFRNGQ